MFHFVYFFVYFDVVKYFPVRYLHALMCFCSFLSLSTTSGILGLTITQMVLPIIANASDVSDATATITAMKDSCPMPETLSINDDNDRVVCLVIMNVVDWHE